MHPWHTLHCGSRTSSNVFVVTKRIDVAEEEEEEDTKMKEENKNVASSEAYPQKLHAWEQRKENTAPLARGRLVPTKESVMDTQELQRTLERYESAIQSSSGDNDDPLAIWLSYIKFVQEHPSPSLSAFALLERCVQSFCTAPQSRYRNDPRFIRICCLYADQTQEPCTTFQQLHDQYHIGTESAVFFNAWAFCAEKGAHYTLAEQVFRQGLAAPHLEPRAYLQTRHARFQKRMSRYWLNASMQQPSADEESPLPPARTIFGSLSSTTHRSSSSSQPLFVNPQRQVSSSHHRPTPFAIAESDDDTKRPFSEAASEWKSEEERWKENRGPLQQWNAFGGLPGSTDYHDAGTRYPAAAVGFDIHVDDDCAPPSRHFSAAQEIRAPLQKDPPPSGNNKPMWKHRLLSHPTTKEEQSFEQARFLAGAYSLLSPSHNFNFFIAEEEEEDRDMSMSMEELMSEHDDSFTSERLRSTPVPTTLRLPNSTPSTEVSLPHARGGEEPTINTQWALRELSMMFASPAGEAAPIPAKASIPATAFTIFCEEGNASPVVVDPETDQRNDENVPYKVGKAPALSIFCDADVTNDTPLHPPPLAPLNPSFDPSSPAAFGDTATLPSSLWLAPPVTAAKHASATGDQNAPAFSIFCDEETHSTTPKLPPPKSLPPNKDSPDRLSVGDTAVFSLPLSSSIFPRDASIFLAPPAAAAKEVSAAPGNHSAPAFTIFCDEETHSAKPPLPPLKSHLPSPDHDSPSHLAVGDTAIFSLPLSSSIFLRDTAKDPVDTCASDGDTVTFSVLSKELKHGAVDTHPSTNDPEATLPVGGTPQSDITGPPSPAFFGDISIIAPNDIDETMHFLPKGIGYAELLQRNIQAAQEKFRTSTASATAPFPRRKPLSQVLSAPGGRIYRLPTHVLPRSLKQATPGTQVTLDSCTGIVDSVWCQDAQGMTFAMKDDSNTLCMIKSQSPIGSLAWEQEILFKMEQRLPSGTGFPQLCTFVTLADGALLSINTGRSSGLNLADLHQVYEELGEEVPELVALHYAARMLHTLECLHWHAKILHCNARPENWIITANDVVTSSPSPTATSDLVLVNFEQSIDLQEIASNGHISGDGWMDALFLGDTTGEEMKCVAMRLGLPWSFDIDTFGVCTSLHFLLFGTPMDMEKSQNSNGSQRWLPKRPFPRHFEKELWIEIFDTLLNLDEDFGRAIGSRPYSVKQLRQRIEDYLVSDRNDVPFPVAWQRHTTVLSNFRGGESTPSNKGTKTAI